MSNQLTLEQAIKAVSAQVSGTIEDLTIIDSYWETPATNPNGVVFYRKASGETVCHNWSICKESKQVSLFWGTYGEGAYLKYLEKRQRKGWEPA